jgi:hypothetical protein
MKKDAQLVDLFLKGYGVLTNRKLELKERPDERERKEPAIDAMAQDEKGNTLAIEHTLVQPFEGQKSDDQPFNAVFERLSKEASLLPAGRLVELWAPAFAIPKGVDWQDVGDKVFVWFKETSASFPRDGEASYKVPGLSFELTLRVQTMEVPDTPGLVAPGRIMPKDRPFADVIHKALAGKLPKLAATSGDARILLLEDASMALGLTQVARALDSCQSSFEEMKQIESIWLALTATWQNGRQIWFFHVWPGGVRERFLLKVDTMEIQIPNRKG